MKRLLVPCLLVQSNLFAATSTWSSTSSSSMNTAGNWGPPGVPSNGTSLVFPPTAGNQFTVINDIGPYTLSVVSGSEPNSLSITNNGSTAYTISPSVAANVFNVPASGIARIVFGSSSGSLASILAVPIDLNGGTLNLIGSAAYDRLTGGITGSGTLQVLGGTIQISGTNTYTGATNVNPGTLRLGSGSSLPSGTTLTVSTGGVFDLNGQTQTLTPAVTVGTAGIVNTGTGTLAVTQLSGGGTVFINTGGTLRVTNSGANTLPTTLVTGSTGAGGTLELGTGSTGTLTVSGANAYSTQTNIGFTTVTAGTLQAGSASAFGTKSNLSIASMATLDLNGNTTIFNTLTGAGTLTLGTANATVSSGANNTFSGTISGTGSSQFIYAGSDKLTLSGTVSVPTIAITGGGTLNVTSLSGSTPSILFETTTNGTLQFGSGFTASVPMTLSSANANIDTQANTVTLNGNITAGGSLTKKGTGTLILGGTGNNYSGGTIVSQGTLQLPMAVPTAFPTNTPLSITSGSAIFDLQGNSITISTLSGTGTLSMGAGTATVSVGGTTFSGAINGSGGLIYSGNATTLTLQGTNGYTGTTSITGTGTLNVVQSAFNTTTGLIFSGSGGTLQAGGPLSNSIPVTLSANGAIDTAGHTCTFSGQITGASGFSLTKQGTGTLILDSMTSNYAGQTNVFAGTLQAGHANAFGTTSALNIKTDAVADLNNNNLSIVQLLGDPDSSLLLGSGTLTITGGAATGPFYGVISESGDVVLDGGEPTFMGDNTYTGTTTIQSGAQFNTFTLNSITGEIIFGTGGGTLTIGSTTSTSSDFTLTGVSTIATNTFDLTVTGVVTGTSSDFKKLGTGTLFLNPGSSNDFTMTPITIQGGTLEATADGLGTPASLMFQDFCGELKIDDPLTITSPITVSSTATINTNGNAVAISSDISKPAASTGLPSGGLRKSGAGVLTLSGTNDYTAPTTIAGGTLKAPSSSLPVSTLIFSGDGTGIFQADSVFGSFPVVILNSSGTIDTNGNAMTMDNIIAGSNTSSITKTGTGVLSLTAANLYTGTTIIANGTLQVTAASLPAASGVQFGGSGSGIFQAGGAMPTVTNSFTFPQNGTINTNGNAVGISGILSGVGGLTKSGAGTLTLSGANTYSGATVVSAGTLQAGVATGSSGAFGENSAVSVNMGATLNFSTFANSVASLSNSGTVLSSATITTGTFAQTSGGAMTLNFPSTSASPVGNVMATGAIALDGALTVTGGYNGSANVILLQSSGSGKQISGAFSTTTPLAGYSIRYDYGDNQVILTSGGGGACDGSWNTGSGNWGVTGNWTPCAPGLMDNNNDAATFSTGAGMIAVTLADSAGTAAQNVTLEYIDFDSSMASYTIQQYMGGGTITLDDTQPLTKPAIHVISGTHTINAPIVLNQASRLMISAGSLTLGPAVTITSTAGTWHLSEGSGSGTLINNGTISPSSLLVEGNTIDNNNIISPTGAVAITGLGGSSGAIVNNHQTLTAGTTFLVGGGAGDSTLTNDAGKTVSSIGAFTIGGGAGVTTLTNSGTISSGSTLLITSGTVTNNTGGLISSTGTLTMNGGTVANNGGAFGASGADLVFNGGSLTSQSQILAKDYTQGSSATLTLNFPTGAATPVGNVSTTGAINLAGSLIVTTSGYGGGTNVILLESSGTGKQLQGSFSSVMKPFGTIRYDYGANQVILASGGACDGTWNLAGSGDWNVGGNWTPCIPGVSGNVDDSATFPSFGAIDISIALPTTGVTLQYLDFDADDTSYTIVQTGGMGLITMDDTQPTTPTLHIIAGTHTINAPIALNQNSRFMISDGSLTLGPSCTVTSTMGIWHLSEGNGSGVLNNDGTISPSDLLVTGNTINNDGNITPLGSISLSGLGGNLNTVLVNNNAAATITSGTTFAIGASGGLTTVNNAGTMTSTTSFAIGSGSGSTTFNNTATAAAGTTFTIASGTVNNNSGATMSAAAGSTFTVSGGSIANNTNGTIGSSTADFVFSGGALATFGHILASNYTQSGSATLQTHVASLTEFGDVAASGTGDLGGNLIVYADPGISLVHGNKINLLTAAGGRNAQFASVSFQNFPPSLIPSIIYLSNAVELDIQGTNPTPSHGSTNNAVFNAIGQHNSLLTLQMMHMRDRMGQGGGEETTTAARFLPYSVDELLAENEMVELPLAAEPEILAQQPGIIQKTEQLTERVQQEAFPWSVYGGPVASFGHVDSKGDQLGMGYASAGALAGFDRILDDVESRPFRAGVGALVEYRNLWATINSNGGSNSTNRIHGSVYATAIPKSIPDLAIEAIAGFAFNWDSLVRNTGPERLFTAKGSTTEAIGDVLLGFEYTLSGNERFWLPCNFTIIPLLTWQYIVDRVGAFSESGAGIYDLHYDSYLAQSVTSVLGARFQYLFRGDRADLRMEIDAGWQHEYLNRAIAVTATAFTITSGSFTSTSVPPGRNSLILALDLLGLYNGGWTIEANATYQLNSLYYDVFFYLGFGREF